MIIDILCMGLVRKEITVDPLMTSLTVHNEYCVYGVHCRYEHSKPLKQEEVNATDLSAKPSLAASSSLSSGVGSLAEMNPGEAESRNSNFPTVRAGSEDWVNAIEFVPGQPYCGRTAPFCTEISLQGSVTKEESEKEPAAVETKKQLCPYAAVGECRYGENCVSPQRLL